MNRKQHSAWPLHAHEMTDKEHLISEIEDAGGVYFHDDALEQGLKALKKEILVQMLGWIERCSEQWRKDGTDES